MRRLRSWPLSLLLLAVFPLPGMAQDYPSRPIKLVVPFSAGQIVDSMARVVAEALRLELGQPVIVDNRPGALGAIGSEAVARSTADGYTILLVSNGTHAANSSLLRHLPYDPAKDFKPIALLGTVPWVLLAKPDFPAGDIGQFLAYARAKPGLPTGQASASSLICAEMLQRMGKLEMLIVPYKAMSQALTDLQGGLLSVTFAPMDAAIAHVSGGRLKALGTTARARSRFLPPVPAIAESLPGYEVISWFGLVAPAQTPDPVIERLFAAVQRVMDKPDVTRAFELAGTETSRLPPDKFGPFIVQEVERWKTMAADAGIEPQ